jgi:hypothetical protein
VNDDHTDRRGNDTYIAHPALEREHLTRIAMAENILRNALELDLAVASPATLAITCEELRGLCRDLLRLVRDHHPEA